MNLILFFNGWGVPNKTFENLDSNNFEIKIIDLEENLDLELLLKYETIHILGWSFGVYNASCQLGHLDSQIMKKIGKTIAINGTSKPIDRRYGISPIIFKKTLDTLDERNYINFMTNIGLDITDGENWENYRGILQRFSNNYKDISSIFKFSLISSKDKIFTPRSLKNFYKDNNYKVINEDHYPFDRWETWEEILDEF